MNFTPEQQRVIDSRNKNILVAAAAGSGKTAVLVSRIIGLVMDKENPVDIDRILVVTFTNAAAQEMKERIRNALEDALEKDPDNDYLIRQTNLVHSAHIMTIDSFCRMVILDNFERVGIEPQVRIADENELAIMREDAASDVMDKFYEEGSEEFLDFLEEFSTQKDDSDVVDAILGIYNLAQSKVEPLKWIMSLEESYKAENPKELEELPWMKTMMDIVSEELAEAVRELETAKEYALSPSGPQFYADTLEEDIAAVREVINAGGYSGKKAAIENLTFSRLSSKKSTDTDPDLKERTKSIRDSVKKSLGNIKDSYFGQTEEEIIESLNKARPIVREISLLTRSFTERFGEIKEEKNIIDFSDLEHIALNALKTGADEGYREYFAEVMTDEYQDSNSVQEEILTSVADDNNYFCVGDVKQSIYGFRLADPDIFMKRYAFSAEDEKSERILLARNFRSRREVLDSVNAVFRVIMHENIGGVEYDDDAALYCGASYGENESDHMSELILIESDDEGEIDSVEAEARVTADRIRQMKGKFMVQSIKDGSVHPADYSDFAILLRSLKGADEIYARVLEEAGIPVFMESRTGYFQTEEIRTILSFLSIINNPDNDIALAAVMLSVIGGFSDEEMALIREHEMKGSFYRAVLTVAGRRIPEDIAEGIALDKTFLGLSSKCEAFLQMLDSYRALSSYTPIHSLIERIIDERGYALYAMARGGSASANLSLLVKKAEDFERTSYKGIFFFLRYIEKLKKYDMDFGEAKGSGETVNAVSLMSIHKSKGLEFPVVFIGQLSKKFNSGDLRAKVVKDPEIGIGIERTDKDTRIRHTVAIKNVISEKKRRNDLGEELRILYVAMTRAKEKLILTAVTDDAEKLLASNPKSVSHASSNLDFIMRSFGDSNTGKYLRTETKNIRDVVFDTVIEDAEKKAERDYYEKLDLSQVSDEETFDRLKTNLSWVYPFEEAFHLPAKLSVSRIKEEMKTEEPLEVLVNDEEGSGRENGEKDGDVKPDEIESDEAAEEKMRIGAMRGTAYHKVFELLPLGELKDISDIDVFFERLLEEERIEEEALRLVKKEDILVFAKSSLAERMEEAGKKGNLFREQPFIIARPAGKIRENWTLDEDIQIQGIIDAFFIENDNIYLVDYKTDRGVDEEILRSRYKVQMDIYADALKGILGIEVAEKIIYSVYLKKTVKIEEAS